MSETFDRVTGVHLFPIKGCQEATISGCQPEILQVGPVGFEARGVRDREFVIIEDELSPDGTHLFVSQRSWDESGRPVRGHEDNKLASVETNVASEALGITADIGSFALASAYTDKMEQDARKKWVTIHGKLLPAALDQGPEAAEFFSDLLGRAVRLVRANRSSPRWLPEKYLRHGATNKVAGADGFPFLLTSHASLEAAHELNGLEQGAVPLSQYRGNIEMNGYANGPWAEDYMRKIDIAGQIMYVVKPSARCIVTTFDQFTGERGIKGLRVLRGHGGYHLDSDKPEAFLGQNLNHVHDPHEPRYIGVGDRVQVLEKADQPNFVPST